MPTIPRATDLGRATPQSREQVNVDVGQGSRALAGALTAVADVTHRKHLEDRQNSLDDAELAMAIALEKESRAYDQDSEWQTIPERSDASMDQALGTIASGIHNTEDREKFTTRQKLNIERTRAKVQGVAWGKERDHFRGRIDGQLDDARDAALSGDMGEVSGLVKRRIDSAVAKGYYGAEEADALYRKWQDSAAVGKLEMMEPENRIEALKKPWADNLPPDTRVKLQRAAEDELLISVAQNNVDEIMAADGMTYRDGMAIIGKLKDADERKATEDRFRRAWTDQEVADKNFENELYDKHSLGIMDGGKTDDIPRDEWEAMPTTMRVNLKNLETSSFKPRKVSDPAALNEAIRLSAKGDYRSLKQWINLNGSLLSNADREQYLTAAEKGMVPVGVTDQQAINSITDDKQQRTELLPVISQWRNQYVQLRGEEPTPDQRDAELKRLIMEADGRGGWFSRDPDIYELEQQARDEELAKVHLLQLEEKDKVVYSETRNLMAGDENRFEFEEAFNGLSTIKATDPEGYQDVMDFIYEGSDIPTTTPPNYQKFLNTYSRLMEIRARGADQ